LAESEAKVEELTTQIVSSQEKLVETGKQLEAEAQRVSEAENNIRTEHAALVEKLHVQHKTDIEGLQTQLAEAENAKAAIQSESLKAIKDALM
jgi:predicted  nucleic acid-binding Zn-ribbon protein